MNPSEAKEWIDIGSPVVDAQGQEVGKVGYVVVNPDDLHVTDIVVNTGTLLGRDIVVPSGSVKEIRDSHVYLSIPKDELEKLPDYVEINYKTPPEGWEGLPSMYFPEQAVLWPAYSPYYVEPSSVEVNTPPGTVGLHKGMDVVSKDGHKVGSVEALEEDAATNSVADVIIKQGVLFSHDTQVPADLIDRIENDQVVLKLTRDEIQQRLEKQGPGGFNRL